MPERDEEGRQASLCGEVFEVEGITGMTGCALLNATPRPTGRWAIKSDSPVIVCDSCACELR